MAGRPQRSDAAEYYFKYIDLVTTDDVVALMEKQLGEAAELFAHISEEKSLYRYAPGKWSLKEVVGHVCDTERVFAYRALRFARGDATPLPSFDEQDWMKDSPFGQRTLADLLAEFHAVRRASLALFEYLPQGAATRRGIASGKEISVRALAYTTAGHAHHHFRVIRERYL